MSECCSHTYVGICDHNVAKEKEITQLGVSACGVTALANSLCFLDALDREEIIQLDFSMCILRRRNETAPLPEYLLSRYDAGCTGEELCDSMDRLLEAYPQLKSKLVTEGFFPCTDLSSDDILDYLASKLSDGCVVIATMNLQLFGNDAWHHQMIYGVDKANRQIYMTNPLSVMDSDILHQVLSTPSVLLIHREDVMTRLDRTGGDDKIFTKDKIWENCNIPQQLARMVKEETIKYLVIPAAYVGGLAVFRKL